MTIHGNSCLTKYFISSTAGQRHTRRSKTQFSYIYLSQQFNKIYDLCKVKQGQSSISVTIYYNYVKLADILHNKLYILNKNYELCINIL